MTHRLIAALAPLLIVILAACSGDDDSAATPTTAAGSTATASDPATTPAAGSPTPAETVPPLPDALREVLDNVADVRGLDPPDRLRAEVVARADLPDLLDTLLTDDDERLMAEATTLYRLLGHFDADQTYQGVYEAFGATSILGLYSPLHDTLWVVSDSGAAQFDSLSPFEETTLAHELIHAIQDHHFQLDQTYELVKDDLDRSLAWTATVEGDAVTHESAYSDEYLALPLAGRLYAVGIVPQVGDVPLSFVRELLFPYTTGADWVEGIVDDHGRDAVDALLAEPPAATSLVLHPGRHDDDWQPQPVTLPDLADDLGDGWQQESGGTLGEFHLGNFLDLHLPRDEAASAADGWDGDRYDVYVDDTGASLTAHRIAFTSDAEAAEFAESFARLVDAQRATPFEVPGFEAAEVPDGRGFAWRHEGPTVTFAIASTPDLAARALESLTR